jgi:hypothetical protein
MGRFKKFDTTCLAVALKDLELDRANASKLLILAGEKLLETEYQSIMKDPEFNNYFTPGKAKNPVFL